MKTLKRGDKGSEVRTLQGYLNLIQDGVFGALTEEAVKMFQNVHYLTDDGIVGPKTWAVLNAVTRCGVKKSKRKITMLILHCTATPEGKDYTVETIRKWHLDRGWSDIGYHYVIYRDGSVHCGRDVDLIGAHTVNFNVNSIGICYVGGINELGTAKDTRTQAQKDAMNKLVKELLSTYNLKLDRVFCHNQFASKACPSFKIEEFRKEFTN